MLEALFETLGSVVSGFLDVLSSLFSGIVDIFYTAGEAGATGEFTFLGTVLLIGVGTPLVFWAINWVIGLLRKVLKK